MSRLHQDPSFSTSTRYLALVPTTRHEILPNPHGGTVTDTNPKTAFICATCRECNRHGDTHPGVRHQPGICDCPCREEP